jgi:DNA invertase Pin-like site-specific DNA recombinase
VNLPTTSLKESSEEAAMTRVAIYTRISMTDKETDKVSIQAEQCEELAAKRGWEVVETFTDDGITASKESIERPGFEDLLAGLEAKRFDKVVATEEERLARNVTDKQRLSVACIAATATWTTIRDGDVDPFEAAGEFMSTIRAAVGRMESRRKAERQAAANAARRHSGRPSPGKRPFGYAADRMTLVPEEAALIREGIDMVLSGIRPHSIAKHFNASGRKTSHGNNWTTTSVVSVLDRWRNAGWTTHHREPVAEATWPAICTREELETVQAILATKKSYGWRTPVGLVSAIAKCSDCGAGMLVTGYAIARHYRCSENNRPGTKLGRHPQLQMEPVDASVREAMLDFYLRIPWQTIADDSQEDSLGKLHRELDEIQRQQEKLTDAYLDSDCAMPKRVYVQRSTALAAHEIDIEARINAVAARSAHASLLVKSRAKLVRLTRAQGVGITEIAASEAADATRDDLARAWDELSLVDRARLVDAAVQVEVCCGRAPSAERVRVVVKATGQVLWPRHPGSGTRMVLVRPNPRWDDLEQGDVN